MYGEAAHKHMHGVGLFLLVIIFLITYMLLTFYNPKFVHRKVNGHSTHENDTAVTMIWSLVITLAVVFVLGLLWYAFSCH